ncbi:MAG: cob(I)yrinic acid a,c-diamide adenosyltransferase [Candidatus Heimdallarchaeum endolithica]|uniref:Cob(I)yrinic acid a,c-diamide adenosyltransferase n=1 Tax=Candidatus Heimdallarchaeum endolithica TaxID=2876572 RepID=A0A9Y1FMH4_9ARCH|nr:MAG: cob(I)yrinic acid a,c-diamide adenosyltransferase [Candidatus Heimdallarchaeum endolithica]
MVQIEIIWGDGRGKTTNAVGKILRSLIDNKKVTVIQFLKTGKECGECKYIKEKFNLNWFTIGKEKFFIPQKNEKEFREFIKEQISIVKEYIKNTKNDVLILDELGFVLYYKLVQIKDIYPLIEQTSEKIIITGRLISKDFKNIDSDLVIKEIRHPFQKGIFARKGVDY